MRKKIILKIFIFLLFQLFLSTVRPVTAQTVMYIDPPRIPEKPVAERCTLKVRIKNATGVFGWQIAKIYFDPNILLGVSVVEDSFLKYAHGVNHSTIFNTNGFDNTNGFLGSTMCMQMFTSDSGGVGDGPLMKLIFEIKSPGASVFNLVFKEGLETYLINNQGHNLSLLCIDGFYGNDNVLPTPSFAINTQIEHQIRPAVDWDISDDEFLVVWDEYSTAYTNNLVRGQRISSSGVKLGSVIWIGGDFFYNTFSPDVCWDGGNFLVIYTRRFSGAPQGNYDIFACPISADGTIGTETGICNADRYQCDPAITWNGTDHLVVWEDLRNDWGNPDIYGQLVNSDGSLVGSNFLISGTPDIVESNPCIASDGNNFIVVWTQTTSNIYGPICGQRIDANGNLIGSAFQISSQGAMPDVAFDGANYLVTYQKPTTQIEWDIYAQRVSPAGALVGSEFAINTASGDQTMPRVIYEPSSGKYLVIWVSEGSMPAIYGQRVNIDGTLYGSPFLLADASYHQIYPSIAYGSTSELIAWADLRSGTDFDIYGYNPEPLGIEIESNSLTASPSNNGIILNWRTECENSISEFRLKRSEKESEYNDIARISGSVSSPSAKSYSYKDKDVVSGIRYYYKLGVVKTDGNTNWYGPVSAVIIGEKPFLSISPNPFTQKTVIRYSSIVNSKDAHLKPCSLRIYDVSGRLVKRFTINDSQLTGVTWDGKDDAGRKVSPGLYFVSLNSNNYKGVWKVILLK